MVRRDRFWVQMLLIVGSFLVVALSPLIWVVHDMSVNFPPKERRKCRS